MKDQKKLSRRAMLRSGAVATGALIAGGASGVAGARPGNGKDRQCDLVVPDEYESVQEAVDDADAGDTICVRPGTYTENVTVDVEVTLRGRTPADSENPAVIDGWVSLDADGSQLRQMVVSRTSPFTTSGFTPDPFGVRVTASDTVVAGNIVRDLTDTADPDKWGALNGIQVFGSESLSDVTVRDNEVRDITKEVVGGVAGIKLQADVTAVEVTGNSVTDLHSSGWGWGVVLTGSGSADGYPEDVLVEDNTVDRLNDGTEYDVVESRDAVPYPGSAFGVDAGAKADEATVRYNNLLAPNGAESKDEEDTLVAECNWWGSKSGPTDEDNPDGEGTWALERGSATIDFRPWLNAPAPSRACVGGEDESDGRGQ